MENIWETDDMSLAAFISLSIDEDPELEWDDDTCYYYFPDTSELRDLIAQYYGNQATVNPREYNREVTRLKRATFRHPDSPKRRFRPRRQAQIPA